MLGQPTHPLQTHHCGGMICTTEGNSKDTAHRRTPSRSRRPQFTRKRKKERQISRNGPRKPDPQALTPRLFRQKPLANASAHEPLLTLHITLLDRTASTPGTRARRPFAGPSAQLAQSTGMPCSRSHPRFSTTCTPGAAPRTRQVPNARAVLSFMRRELLLMFVAGACWACRAALVHAPGCPDPCSLGDVYCNGRSHERLRGESGIVRGLCGAVLGARGRVVGRVFGAGGLDWGRWRNGCCRGMGAMGLLLRLRPERVLQ